MEPFTITIGLELEFLVAYYLNGRFEHLEQEGLSGIVGPDYARELGCAKRESKDQIRRVIASALTEAGVETHDYDSVPRESSLRTAKWEVSNDASVTATPAEDQASILTFANGDKVPVRDGPKVHFCDVEVKSRILPFGLQIFAEIERVVQVIRMFPALVNSTCALHVHVGNWHRGYPLQTVKNLMTLGTCFDSLLNKMHPQDRTFNQYCMGLPMAFQPEERARWHMAREIDRAETLDELIAFFRRNRNDHDQEWSFWSYSIANLATRLKTIEFRQHRGTLETDEILRWVYFATAIIGFSHDLDNPYIQHIDWVNQPWIQPNVVQLLKKMYLEHVAKMVEGRLYEHDPLLEPLDYFLDD